MVKSGTYHIIYPWAQLHRERVRRDIDNSTRRHRYHFEETFQAICGATTPRDSCCNLSIANPNWNYNWCHGCVKAITWNDDGKRLWLERHGIGTYTEAAD